MPYEPTLDEIEALGMEAAEVLTQELVQEQKEPASVNTDTFKPTDPSSHYSPGKSTSIEDRALKLLGSGVGAESVASALGVTPSRISQLLAVEEFSKKVADLRYESLQSHNKRDNKYDTLEDALLAKLQKSLPLLVKPESIMKAISVVNGAKRRGQSAPEAVANQQNIVNIILPSVIADKFTTNAENQVIKAGDQNLVTMQSGNLLKTTETALLEKAAAKQENNI